MESNAALVRLKEFQIDGHRRKASQIATMIAEFDRLAAELDREINAEETRSGKHDPAHFAYPTYAKAARARRDNLKRSKDELAAQLAAERMALADVLEEMVAMAPAPTLVPAQAAEFALDLNRAS
jgi:septal ring factor EnvC (AmiA/AmiB activator)